MQTLIQPSENLFSINIELKMHFLISICDQSNDFS